MFSTNLFGTPENLCFPLLLLLLCMCSLVQEEVLLADGCWITDTVREKIKFPQ